VVALTKPDAQIKPGMTATASIVVAQRDNVLMVSNRAVRIKPGEILESSFPEKPDS
jgi:hypothetical protein